MMCNLKNMLKVGGVLAVILAGGFFIFPQFRSVIIGLAPLMLFALCPLSMLFALRGMNKGTRHSDSCTSCVHQQEQPTLKNH